MSFLDQFNLPEVPPAFSDKYLRLDPLLNVDRTFAIQLFLPILNYLDRKLFLDGFEFSSHTNIPYQGFKQASEGREDTAPILVQYVFLSGRSSVGNKETNSYITGKFIDVGFIHNNMLDSVFHSATGTGTMLFTKEKTAVLVSNVRPTDQTLVKLASLIPYIIGARQLDPIVEKICITLGSSKYDEYAELFRQWHETKNFDLMGELLLIIKDSISSVKNNRLTQLQAILYTANKTYEDLSNKLAVALQTIRIKTREIQLEMLAQEENTAVDELLDYIRTTRRDSLISANVNTSGYLNLTLCTPATFFDSELMENLLNAARPNSFNQSEIDKIFWHRLFVDCEYKLILSGTLQLKPTEGAVSSIGMGVGDFEANTLRNPHLHHYGCLGQNKQNIITAFHANNFIMMYENMLASVGGLNFADSGPMSKLVRIDYENPAKCILTPDGRRITLKEFRKDCYNEANQPKQVLDTAATEAVAEELPLHDLG